MEFGAAGADRGHANCNFVCEALELEVVCVVCARRGRISPAAPWTEARGEDWGTFSTE